MEKGNAISTNIDKTGENQQVVTGGKTIDASNGGAANLEEMKRINLQIGQRIADIREKEGLNQAQFYSLLYPDSEEAKSTRIKRMSDIENARAFDEKTKGAKFLDFGRLLFISQRFQVPLDYLLYGKTNQTAETAPVMQEEISSAPEEEAIATTKPQTETNVKEDENLLLTVRSICRFLVAILPLSMIMSI